LILALIPLYAALSLTFVLGIEDRDIYNPKENVVFSTVLFLVLLLNLHSEVVVILA
jgi:hypothetical protein